MTRIKKGTALLLALLLICALTGCRRGGGPSEPPTDPPASGPGESQGTSEPTPSRPEGSEPTAAAPSTEATGATQGPTEATSGPEDPGALTIGLMDDAAALGAAGLYGGPYTLVPDVSDPGDRLVSGALDAALVPLDEAARLYASTDGAVRIAAVTASGGWGIVERGNTVHNIWDLAGKTVYVAEDSRDGLELFTYTVRQYDFVVGDTLFIETVPADRLMDHDLTLMDAEQVGVTIVRDPATHKALDIGQEWTEVTNTAFLPAACLVVGPGVTDEELAALLPALKASQETVSDNLDKAVALGLSDSQEEAWASLECLKFMWLQGADTIREELTDYFMCLFQIDPALIGGYIPDDEFYR